MQTKIGLGPVLAAMALGCAHRSEEHRARPAGIPRGYGRDWNKLGERWVDGAHDRDVIPVGDATAPIVAS